MWPNSKVPPQQYAVLIWCLGVRKSLNSQQTYDEHEALIKLIYMYIRTLYLYHYNLFRICRCTHITTTSLYINNWMNNNKTQYTEYNRISEYPHYIVYMNICILIVWNFMKCQQTMSICCICHGKNVCSYLPPSVLSIWKSHGRPTWTSLPCAPRLCPRRRGRTLVSSKNGYLWVLNKIPWSKDYGM